MFSRPAIAMLCASLGLCGAEKKVQLKDLPAPVRETVKAETQNAKVHGFAEETENGQTFYEAETTTAAGLSRDLLIDASGKVVEVEEQVSLDSLSKPVQQAFRTAAGSGKILKVESVTKGSAKSYEAVVQRAGKKTEVAVNADGTLKKD